MLPTTRDVALRRRPAGIAVISTATTTPPEAPSRPADLYDTIRLSCDKAQRHIRILRIQGDPESTGPITGDLHVVSLNVRPFYRFSALSYTWGGYASPRDTIKCNGFDVEVTENCMAALVQLRKSFGSMFIWIDAICINQGDEAEKLIQLPLMRDIYSHAEFVYVWLGPSLTAEEAKARQIGPKATDRAMDFLARGCQTFGRPLSSDFTAAATTGKWTIWKHVLQFSLWKLPFHPGPHYKGLDDVFSRTWITRLWTLQEAVLAERLIIVCGEKSVPWRAMAHGLQLIDICNEKTADIKFPDSVNHWLKLLILWKRNSSERLPDLQSAQAMRQELDQQKTEVKAAWSQWLNTMAVLHLMVPVLQFVNIFRKELSFSPFRLAVDCIGLWQLISWLGFFTMATWTPNRNYPYSPSVSLMLEIERRQAFSPEDKYNAVFGIAQLQRASQAGDKCDHLYQLLFVDLLRYTADPNILLFASKSRLRNCPSWVIDWNKRPAACDRAQGRRSGPREVARPRPSPWLTAQYCEFHIPSTHVASAGNTGRVSRLIRSRCIRFEQ